jgi:hypothetical protein
MAVDRNTSIYGIPYGDLKEKLVEQGQVLEYADKKK